MISMPEHCVPVGENQGTGVQRGCLSLIPSTELLQEHGGRLEQHDWKCWTKSAGSDHGFSASRNVEEEQGI